MAKKKKTKQPILKGIQTVKYSGKVKVCIQRGNRTIFTKQYNNSGLPNLFRFLALALSGNYTNQIMPSKLKLFGAKTNVDMTSDSAKPNNFSWVNNFSGEKPILEGLSPFINYDTTPLVEQKVDTQNKDLSYFDVTFHFRIPSTLIGGNNIYAIGLFPNNIIDGNEINASAYYLFAEGENWTPLIPEDTTGDFNLVIDWTLSLKNETKGE